MAVRLKDKKIEAGEKLFSEFHGFEAGQIDKVKLDLSIPKTLVKIGFMREIVYHSDKDSKGRQRRYIHDFKRPYPMLCSDVAGKRLFIIGGNFEIKAEGIIN